MLFTANVTAAKSTTEAAPATQTLNIAHGIITKFSVFFPPWSAGQLHCVILHHEHQIAPSTLGMNLAGDAGAIEWEEYYEAYQPPYELKIKAWNDDDTWPHTVTVRVAILPRKAILPLAIVDAIKSLMSFMWPRTIFQKRG